MERTPFLHIPLRDVDPNLNSDQPLKQALMAGLDAGPAVLKMIEDDAVIRFQIPYGSNGEAWIKMRGSLSPAFILNTFSPAMRYQEESGSHKVLKNDPVGITLAVILYLLEEAEPWAAHFSEKIAPVCA